MSHRVANRVTSWCHVPPLGHALGPHHVRAIAGQTSDVGISVIGEPVFTIGTPLTGYKPNNGMLGRRFRHVNERSAPTGVAAEDDATTWPFVRGVHVPVMQFGGKWLEAVRGIGGMRVQAEEEAR